MKKPPKNGRTRRGRKPAQRKPTELLHYEKVVSRELRGLMPSKNLPQKRVAAKLEEIGVCETAKGLPAKLNAGTFTAAYYLAIKKAIDKLSTLSVWDRS